MPTMIAPECAAAGCSHEGDQYTMARCRHCQRWFCAEHLAQDRPVDLVRALSPSLGGLSYYVGVCEGCAHRSNCAEDAWTL